MDELELIKARHSVRAYLDVPLEGEKVEILSNLIASINRETNLRIQLILDEPKAFDCFLAHYGTFSGVKNYIALVGSAKDKNLSIKLGYYGEKLVLKAQEIGLNTCWVGASYKKKNCPVIIEKGEKLVLVIAIGYGKHRGFAHKSKTISQVCGGETVPNWFKQGVEAALLAPTAMNQQKFFFTYLGDNKVAFKTKIGPFAKVDLGIAMCHFEIGAISSLKWVKV